MPTLTPTRPEAAATTLADSSAAAFRRYVVVQSGARDAYQVAIALSEAGMLEALVTDLFWPVDSAWRRKVLGLLPAGLRTLLLQRSDRRLPGREIVLKAGWGGATLALEKSGKAPLTLRRRVMRHTDAVLGRAAGRLAKRRGAGLISYSYYGYDAFSQYGRPGVLFQLHPHPVSVRRILKEELSAHPDCAASLEQEWELALPEEDFAHLVRETKMAAHFLVASTFTKQTLVENGADAGAVSVIPYGVELERYRPDAGRRPARGARLQLLFVGRINQRKGVKYLLEALRLVASREVELTVCGRVVDGLELFRTFGEQVKVRPSVSAAELVSAYQAAELFVFPSVAEGFGLVLLEALASGLPILSTTRTAAPDLIEDGVQGFVVEPRRPEQIAERIEWALTHREELTEMGRRARERAEQFTWARFRAGVVEAVDRFARSAAARGEGRSGDV